MKLPAWIPRACCLGLLLAALPVRGQWQGELGQEFQRNLEADLLRLERKGLMATREALEARFGRDELAHFLAEAVVRLTLSPDGTFTALAREGGAVIAFRLGDEVVPVPPGAAAEPGWLRSTGQYGLPAKPQALALTVRGGGREVTVRCANRYAKSKRPFAFYVGPLNGLFCLGMTEADGP